MNNDYASSGTLRSDPRTTFNYIMVGLLIILMIVLAIKARANNATKAALKPDDKKVPAPGESESGYVYTGVKCNCKDDFGNIYRGDQLLLGDGSKVCVCPDYYAIYGYPGWWGGYYAWPGRRPWRGGGYHGGGYHGGPHLPVRAPSGGMRMGGGGAPRMGGGGGMRMGGGGGMRMGGGGHGGGRR